MKLGLEHRNLLKTKAQIVSKYILKFIFKAFIYVSIFMFIEIFWRSFRYGHENGFVPVPLWMFLVYIHIAWLDDILIPFFNKKNIPKYIQAFYIMVLINIFEFSFGVFFKYGLGIKVWDYTNVTFLGIKANILGIVSLYGIPAWFLVARLLIWIYPKIKAMVDYSPAKQSYFFNITNENEKKN